MGTVKNVGLMSVLAILLALMPAVAFASEVPPGTGIRGSAHDFSGKTAGAAVTGLCTFCHTPHRAQETRLLWNHTLSQNTYSWSDVSQTIGGTPLPTISQTWTGPTKFCLSCHDGSVTIGDIAWFNEKSWTGAETLDTEKHDTGEFNIATPTGDMKGNHPVAHPYPFQLAPSTYNSVATGQSVVVSEFVADPTVKGIRLFTDQGGIVLAGATVGSTGIECSSCHDPHNGPTVKDHPLLRGELGGDSPEYICVKCHAK